MKELILSLILAGNIYPMSGKVAVIDRINETITFETETGMLFEFYTEDYDWMIGDNVAAIMWDNATPDTKRDDEVLCARYTGYDD